jgi:dTDP-4-dehydrorhamnose 3,5-epimerase
MNIRPGRLEGLFLIEPAVFGDARGFFMESWSQRDFEKAGLNFNFVQDNVSRSSKGVLRGLHFQSPHSQGKMVSVVEGEVFDVAVDIRKGSPTFGQWEGHLLSSESHLQFYVPPGFAHGFVVTSETALFTYKCTDFYHPEHECSVLWNDPEIGIEWPLEDVQLSGKDSKALPLSEIPEHLLSFST